MCPALAGVKPLPAKLWQLEHVVSPVWFMLAGVQVVPIVWQLPQVLLVMGAMVCALAPVGVPVADVPLWQVEQLVAAVMPEWLKVEGVHRLVVWQLEHWAYPAVVM